MIKRHLAPRTVDALRTTRVVNIIGPRQAGKSTLIERQVPVAQYLTMDDDALREAVKLDPYTILADYAQRARGSGKPVAIDEVQRVPEITLALKRIVDRNNAPGQFLLSGSSNIFAAPKAMDSLAGRVMSLALRPLSAAEIMGASFCRILDDVATNPALSISGLPRPKGYTRAQAIDQIVRGGFPEIRELADKNRLPRYRSYLDSIIEKDVAAVAAVRKSDDLRRFMSQLGARTGAELNVSSLSSAVGVSWPTLKEWFDVLTQLSIVHRLPGWTPGRSRKDIKSPKIHFMDTGCATATRHETAESFAPGADPTALGAMLETYVFVEIEKTLALLDSAWELYHWRADPHEIDIVAEAPGRKLAAFEMKASATVDARDFKSIDWFFVNAAKAYKGTGFVVYLGDQLLSFGPRKIALPLSMLWSYA